MNDTDQSRTFDALDDLRFETGIVISDEKAQEFLRRLVEGDTSARGRLSDFTPQADVFQTGVIEATDHTIRVVAPAGSGKTQTVVNRAVRRIKDGIKPDRILILTFDTSAAGALSSKLVNLVQELGIKAPQTRTLNSFGYGLLKDHFPHEYKRICPDKLQYKIIKEILGELREKSPDRFFLFPSNLKYSFYLDYFGLLKNELFDPRDFDAQELADFVLSRQESFSFIDDPSDKKKLLKIVEGIIWLFRAFERSLQNYEVMDYDDQKLRAYIGLTKQDEIKRIINNQFSEVIVDEFQDINKLDFELIKVISIQSDLVVVGDDDQAIYGFRGCSPDYIINLANHLGREVKSYELSINYRCPSNIISHADRLIQFNNPGRIMKHPKAIIEELANIKVASTHSSSLEAKAILKYIEAVRKKNSGIDNNFGYQNFAILYRKHTQNLPLQIEFILNGIPYFVRKEDNLVNNQTLEKLLSILKIKLDLKNDRPSSPEDSVAAVVSFFKYVNQIDLGSLRSYFSQRLNFLDLIRRSEVFNLLPKGKAGAGLASAFLDLHRSRNLSDCLTVISTRFHGIRGMIGSLDDVMEDKVPLGEIFDMAANFKGDISEFIRTIELALSNARDQNAGNDKDGGVALCTYFKAKGLQWHTVVLMSCNQGVMPHNRAELADERRLFYVGLTRASSNLFISYIKKLADNEVEPSIFLSQAGLM